VTAFTKISNQCRVVTVLSNDVIDDVSKGFVLVRDTRVLDEKRRDLKSIRDTKPDSRAVEEDCQFLMRLPPDENRVWTSDLQD
jgi:hypothetical protein